MEKLTNNITRAVMIIVMVLSVVVFVMIAMGGETDKATGIQFPNYSAINLGLYLTYVLLGLAVFIAAISMMLNTIMNPKKSLGSIIGFGFFIVVYLISSSLASDVMLDSWAFKNKELFTPENAKFSDTGLYVMYVFSLLSIIAIVFGEGYSMYKKYLAK